jgi:hypothetical protein
MVTFWGFSRTGELLAMGQPGFEQIPNQDCIRGTRTTDNRFIPLPYEIAEGKRELAERVAAALRADLVIEPPPPVPDMEGFDPDQLREAAEWGNRQPLLNLVQLTLDRCDRDIPTNTPTVAEFDTSWGRGRLLRWVQYENYGVIGPVDHYILVIQNPRTGEWSRHEPQCDSEYALLEQLGRAINRLSSAARVPAPSSD